jgi:uncharacterized protein YeaC (DUF1315 family)
MKRLRIHLVSWDKANVDSQISALKDRRLDIIFGVPRDRTFFQSVENEAPDAIVIDLARSPSQGRDIAVNFRSRKSTRAIHIVYISGGESSIAIKALLPDATFSTWETAVNDIREACAHPLPNPVVPGSIFAAYSGVPLAKKLGIKSGSSVLVIRPPSEFKKLLGKLPEGVKLCQDDKDNCNILLWFIRSQADLNQEIVSMAARPDFKSLWMIWPKKSSKLASDLTQQIIRETGLSHGLVDYKICSLDDAWTGLCFAKRK